MSFALPGTDETTGRTRPAALAALAAAAFVYVTSETLPVGLLPQISDGLSVSEGRVGLLLTFYALVAAVTAIPLTAWTTHLPRHRLVLSVVGLLALSQVAAALAPSYWWLVAARLVCAVGHGLFWAVLAPIAARLVPAGNGGRATATVFVGNSLALVLGLPLGTYLGQLAGWQVTFGLTGLAGAVTLALLWRALPTLPGETAGGLSPAMLRRLADHRLLALYAVTMIVVVGQFTAYSYIAPLARVHGGFTGTAYSVVLLGYGLAGLVTVVGAGPFVDRRPRIAFALPMLVVGLALTSLACFGHDPLVTATALIAWGGAFTVLPVMLQSAVLRVAPQVSDVASAVYVVAFQIGIGGGAGLGALLVDGGHLDAAATTTAACAAVALIVGLGTRGLFPARPDQPTKGLVGGA